MNIDERVSDYNKGFQAGQEHTQPSPETKLFMQRVEKTFEDINKKIDNLPTADDITIAVLKANKEFLEQAELKFAPKWVEKVMVWGMGIVGSAVILSILGLVLIQ